MLCLLSGQARIKPFQNRLFMIVTPEMLKTFPVLKSLSDKTLGRLAEQSSIGKFSRREVVLDPGKPQDQLCFLFEGRLQGVDFTIDGREVGLYFVEPGGFCGEIRLYDTGPLPEFVIATTPSVTVFVPLQGMREVMAETAAIGNAIGAKLAERLRLLSFQRSLLSLPNLAQRVCCQLWQLLPANARDKQSQAEIRNPPTHMEIAIMLNLSRESVTRVFQTLQNRQIVKRDGPACLQVLDLAVLKQIAEGESEL